MKKLFVILTLAAVSFVANAQPRAVGLKLGYGVEASYQHQIQGEDFIEATLGAYAFNTLDVSCTYNFMIEKPQWTDRGEWGFYAGPGAALGFGGNFHVAATGQVGLEYTFWFPLQLSFDLRPELGIWANSGVGFYWAITPTIGVRYRF